MSVDASEESPVQFAQKQDRQKANACSDLLRRRNLIGLLTMGVIATVTATRSYAQENKGPVAAGIWMSRLAGELELVGRANSLTAYITALKMVEMNDCARDLQDTLKLLKQNGYRDFSTSKIFSKDGYLTFFAKPDPASYDASVVFMRKQIVSHIALGPTLVALAAAGQQLRREHDAKAVRQMLFPTATIEACAGTFRTGYSRPDMFETEMGQVRITYKPISNDARRKAGRGLIAIKVDRERRGAPLLDQEYEIAFTSPRRNSDFES